MTQSRESLYFASDPCLGEVHFEAWLGLWKRNCSTHLSEADANDMIAIANKIGARLRTIIANHNKPTLDLFS